MKYLNQLDHPDIPYPTDAATEGSRFHDLSIKEAGAWPLLPGYDGGPSHHKDHFLKAPDRPFLKA